MTTPSSPHLALDALADVLAGQGDPAGQQHLAGCGSCTSRLGELRAAEVGVLATLAALPAPELPTGLADRLTAALAAESPLAPATREATVTALAAALPAGRVRRRTWLPAAAAAVLVLTAGGLAWTAVADRADPDAASTAAGAGSAESTVASGLPLTASGTDWADPAAAAAAVPRVVGGQAPRQALAGGAADAAAPSADQDATGTADGLDRLRTSDGLASCLSALLPPEEPGLEPLAVDYATFAGQPALAVVLPDADPTTVSVYVVGAGCTVGADGLLDFRRLPRPAS